MKRIYSRLLFALILLLGLLLRSQETVAQNFIFLIDQGRDMMAVKQIVYELQPTLIGPYTSLQGVFQGPFWYYLLAVPTILFNGDPWGAVLLMLLISIVVVLISYFWTRRLFGERAALITAFLLVVSPEAVAAATYSWNPHPMWLLIVFYIFSLYEVAYLKNKLLHLVLWPAIALMFHFQTALAVFILPATLIFLFIYDRKILYQKTVFYALLTASIFFIPQILFELRHDFLMMKSILNIFSGQDRGLFVGGENRDYMNVVKGNLSLLYYNFSTSFVRDGYLKNFPKIALITIVGSLLLQREFHLFSKKEWNFIFVAIAIVLIVWFFASFYPFPLRYWFFTGFQILYIFIFGLTLSKVFKWTIGKVAVLILTAFLLFYSGERLYTLYIHPPDDGGVAKIRGKIEAIDFIYADSKGEPFGLFIFTPPVYAYAYDYLIWWYGQRRYGYLPHQEKKGTFYTWIEVDPSKPWSYKGWLETVVKVGKPVEEVKLPSGFIVQKYVKEKNDY